MSIPMIDDLSAVFPYESWAADNIQLWLCPGPQSLTDQYGDVVEVVDARCRYCGSEFHASSFHPGACGECGGPR